MCNSAKQFVHLFGHYTYTHLSQLLATQGLRCFLLLILPRHILSAMISSVNHYTFRLTHCTGTNQSDIVEGQNTTAS